MYKNLRTYIVFIVFVCLGIIVSTATASAQDVQKVDTVLHVTDSVRVYFPVSQSVFDFSHEGNGDRIEQILLRFRVVRKNKRVQLDHVSVTSSSSPEGSVPFNSKLSRDRVLAIANYLKEHYAATWDIMDLESQIVDWNLFERLVESDRNIPQRDSVMVLVRNKDLDAVRALKGTPEWDYLLENIFPYLRTSFAVFHYTVLLNQIDSTITYWEGMEEDLAQWAMEAVEKAEKAKEEARKADEPVIPEPAKDITQVIPEIADRQYETHIPLPDSLKVEKIPARLIAQFVDMVETSAQEETEPEIVVAETPEWIPVPENEVQAKERRKRLFKFQLFREDDDFFIQEEDRKPRKLFYHESYVKTNVLFYPLLIPNIGYEWRPFERISFAAHGYYSAVNWFAMDDTKFRVLGLQVEGRYWFRDNMYGPFAGFHATFGWYNVAWGGDYRYQDHQGKTPGYGTGITLGYKVPFMPRLNRGRMGVEFTIGAGVMPLHYDIFYNVPNGRLAGEDRITYWGIDNATISFVWRFAGNRNMTKWWRKNKEDDK